MRVCISDNITYERKDIPHVTIDNVIEFEHNGVSYTVNFVYEDTMNLCSEIRLYTVKHNSEYEMYTLYLECHSQDLEQYGKTNELMHCFDSIDLISCSNIIVTVYLDKEDYTKYSSDSNLTGDVDIHVYKSGDLSSNSASLSYKFTDGRGMVDVFDKEKFSETAYSLVDGKLLVSTKNVYIEVNPEYIVDLGVMKCFRHEYNGYEYYLFSYKVSGGGTYIYVRLILFKDKLVYSDYNRGLRIIERRLL